MKIRKKKLNILVSNDDGIEAEGMQKLVVELKKFANVFVSAPRRQQSAVGHSITVFYPLRAFEFNKDGKFYGIAVEGTPADAVKLGVLIFYKDIKFDLVVSGINHGANTAINIIYSGTVSAATEGTTLNIPSVAVSLATFEKADFSHAAETTAKILQDILVNKKLKLTPKTLLNINFPAVPKEEIKGIVITKQGKSNWDDSYDVRSDPNGREYYWLTGKMNITDDTVEDDIIAVINNYISITPLHYDLTDYKMFEQIKKWNLEI